MVVCVIDPMSWQHSHVSSQRLLCIFTDAYDSTLHGSCATSLDNCSAARYGSSGGEPGGCPKLLHRVTVWLLGRNIGVAVSAFHVKNVRHLCDSAVHLSHVYAGVCPLAKQV